MLVDDSQIFEADKNYAATEKRRLNDDDGNFFPMVIGAGRGN